MFVLRACRQAVNHKYPARMNWAEPKAREPDQAVTLLTHFDDSTLYLSDGNDAMLLIRAADIY